MKEKDKELEEALNDMVESLKDLPEDVLQQLLDNLDEIAAEQDKNKN